MEKNLFSIDMLLKTDCTCCRSSPHPAGSPLWTSHPGHHYTTPTTPGLLSHSWECPAPRTHTSCLPTGQGSVQRSRGCRTPWPTLWGALSSSGLDSYVKQVNITSSSINFSIYWLCLGKPSDPATCNLGCPHTDGEWQTTCACFPLRAPQTQAWIQPSFLWTLKLRITKSSHIQCIFVHESSTIKLSFCITPFVCHWWNSIIAALCVKPNILM